MNSLNAFFTSICSSDAVAQAVAKHFSECGITGPGDFAHEDFGNEVRDAVAEAEMAQGAPEKVAGIKAKVASGKFKANVAALKAAGKGGGTDEDEDEEEQDPSGFGRKKLVRLLADKPSDAVIAAAVEKVAFVLVAIDPATGSAVVDVEKTLAALRETGNVRPAAPLVGGLTVVAPSDLAKAKSRDLEPWNGKETTLGTDANGIPWGTDAVLTDRGNRAFTRFMRTRSRLERPVDRAHEYVKALRAAGSYRKLAESEPEAWSAVVAEYDRAKVLAANRGEDLEAQLLAELVKRDSVPPGSQNPLGGAMTVDRFSNLTPTERDVFADALANAFPGMPELRALANRYSEGMNFDAIPVRESGKGRIWSIARALVTHAVEANNGYRLLITAMHLKPNSEYLRDVDATLMAGR